MNSLTKNISKEIVYGYARVSTKKQESEGYSLEAQKEQIENFCNQRNYDLKGFYSEALSGKDDKRPKLQEALRLCKLSDATLVVAKIDRLTRDLHFLTKLQKEGVKFIALDMPEANSAMLQVMITFAEFDNKLRSTRIKEGMAKAKKAGKEFGTDNLAPYYAKLEKEIDPDNRRAKVRKLLEKPHKLSDEQLRELRSEEATLVAKIRELYATPPTKAREQKARQRALELYEVVKECESEGHTSYSALAKCLSDKGIKTPRGKDEWTRQNIQTLKIQLRKLKEEKQI